MKNLKEFKASGENSSVPDPIDRGDTSLPTGKKRGEGQDPMPKLPGNEDEKPDMIAAAINATQAKAPKNPADNVNPQPMEKLKGMREMLNVMSSMSAEQIAEVIAAVKQDEADASDEEVKVADLVREDFDALFGSAELSEEAKARAFALFESAILTKLAEETNRLEAEYEVKLTESIRQLAEEQEERLNNYLDYVANEWMEENRLAVDNGIKIALNESFIEGLKNLFEEHYVNVPEGREDVFEALAQRVEDLESALNEVTDENLKLINFVKGKALDEVNEEVLQGLTETQKEKVLSLTEGLDYNDIEEYETKLQALKETVRKGKDPAKSAEELNEAFVEDKTGSEDFIDPTVSKYIKAFKQSAA